jgi:hypothetical protein
MAKRATAALIAGCIGLTSSSVSTFASEENPTQQELMDQIRALKAQVEKLEAAQVAQQSKLESQDASRTVEQVLSDADRRSQLLQATGFTAGYNKGKFVIQSEDGNFLLNPQLQFQMRYVYNYRDEDAGDPVDGDATNESGFEVRRLKLNFEGNVFSPSTTYKLQWATSRSNGNLILDEGFVKHKFASSDFAVKVGQYKDVTFHEELLSSKRQLAVDRSLANEFLAGGVTDFIQGIALIWDDGAAEGMPLRAEVGYTDGPNSDNTNFVDGGGSGTFGVANPDYGAYGRVEYLAFGDWKQYEDFTAMNNTQDVLVLGAGAFYTEAGDGRALFHTLDAQWEVGALGLYAAYYGVYSDPGDDGDTAYDVGGVAQAGYMFAPKWEGFGRYSLVVRDSGGADSDDNYSEFTAGVNYFISGHAAKITVDATYLPNGVPADQNGIGELDPDADDSQIVVRGQFQLLL